MDRSLQGMGLGMVSNGLGLPALASTVNNMSYGSPPYRGTGMAAKLTPEAISALGSVATNVAPFGVPLHSAGAVKHFSALGGGMSMQANESLDSVIQNLLNALGRQANNK